MWKPSNPFGLVALVPCTVAALLALGGLLFARDTYLGGPGMLMLEASARRLASLLAQPPASNFAGSEWRALVRTICTAGIIFAYATFGVLFYLGSNLRRPVRPATLRRLLGAQVLLCTVFTYDLVYFVALEVGYLLSLPKARRWLVLTLIAIPTSRLLALADLGGAPTASTLVNILLQETLQVAGFIVGHLLARERRGREAVARAHRELQATQRMLADLVRNSERARMARGLHDAIGHHLTALHLHLDLARRQAPAPVPALDVARQMAATLLAEIRAIIGAERAHLGLDLEPAIRTLCGGVPSLQVKLAFCAPAFDAPLVAEAVFRVVQEGLTNAMRHAQAGTVWVHVLREPDRLIVRVEDDGAARTEAAPGNGLRGLREQVENAGGRFAAGPLAEGGFGLCATMPLERRS